MGQHVVQSNMFHKPIRKTFATEYVDSYNITHGVNPFHLKSAANNDIGKDTKKMWSQNDPFEGSYKLIKPISNRYILGLQIYQL